MVALDTYNQTLVKKYSISESKLELLRLILKFNNLSIVQLCELTDDYYQNMYAKVSQLYKYKILIKWNPRMSPEPVYALSNLGRKVLDIMISNSKNNNNAQIWNHNNYIIYLTKLWNLKISDYLTDIDFREQSNTLINDKDDKFPDLVINKTFSINFETLKLCENSIDKDLRIDINNKTAIEVELSTKDEKRYMEIFDLYDKLVRAGIYEKVVYICLKGPYNYLKKLDQKFGISDNFQFTLIEPIELKKNYGKKSTDSKSG